MSELCGFVVWTWDRDEPRPAEIWARLLAIPASDEPLACEIVRGWGSGGQEVEGR